jgi:ribosome biogenesis GTPase
MCTVTTGVAEVRAPTRRGVEVAVGDWVGIDPGPTTGGSARIEAVLPRRCVFRRAADARGATPQIVAANIDTVFVCDALDGRLGLRHLERFLALVWQGGATPVVLITKSDGVPPAVVVGAVGAVEAVAQGVDVLVVSSSTGEGLDEVAQYMVPGRTVALLGLSGAGKSTLVNRLAGADILRTGAVRKDGQGRHTTTHRQLVLLPAGGLLIDTPGMRTLAVAGTADGVEEAFHDVEVFARGCRYPSCSHAGEPGCAVAMAMSEGRVEPGRVESWLQLRTRPASAEREGARRVVDERKRRKRDKLAARRAART